MYRFNFSFIGENNMSDYIETILETISPYDSLNKIESNARNVNPSAGHIYVQRFAEYSNPNSQKNKEIFLELLDQMGHPSSDVEVQSREDISDGLTVAIIYKSRNQVLTDTY